MTLSHLVHHRGQLSLYLRLMDAPVPRSYGPTADEPYGGRCDGASPSWCLSVAVPLRRGHLTADRSGRGVTGGELSSATAHRRVTEANSLDE